jgi:6-phospho-5-dehydro-2-deoxy-D-gluconate aldolase
VNTECLQAWTRAVRHTLKRDSDVYDPRTILTPGKKAVMATVKEKMREFHTSHKV